MIGAIAGDIAGSRFESRRENIKTKEFEFFTPGCRATDDSIMTLAVARALLRCRGNYDALEAEAVSAMRHFGRLYPDRGYGKGFKQWLFADDPKPYNSCGNGAAMRVSACGLAAGTLDEAKLLARKVTAVTHNHPEGIKGAEAAAVSVFLAREGRSPAEIREHVREHYYALDFTLDEIRGAYEFDATCQGSVPQAITAFLESNGFEDAVRNAISIGGDSDTLAAIAGGIAEAFYGVPADIRKSALIFLDERLLRVVADFEKVYPTI